MSSIFNNAGGPPELRQDGLGSISLLSIALQLGYEKVAVTKAPVNRMSADTLRVDKALVLYPPSSTTSLPVVVLACCKFYRDGKGYTDLSWRCFEVRPEWLTDLPTLFEGKTQFGESQLLSDYLKELKAEADKG